jgi:hypothetical protein
MIKSIYGPLQAPRRQIRLLELLPGLNHEKICCQIYTVSLNDHPHYHALSYVWGDPKVTDFISVNGQDIPVTTNLKAALLHLRVSTRIIRLWIDAVYINQADIPERNQQVQIMHHIYSSAYCVYAWLGEETEGSTIAMHLLEDLSGQYKDHIIAPDAPLPLPGDLGLWKLLIDLLERPFWTRGWIFQEIVLARKVIFFCGRRSVEWKIFELSLDRLEVWARRMVFGSRSEAINQAVSFRIISVDWEKPGLQIRFPDLLHKQTRFRSLSDPRDVVYSVIGLARDISPGIIEPDYSKSVQSVYQSVTRSVIEDTGRLDMLSHTLLHLNAPGSPSWVRDWTIPSPVTPFYKSLPSRPLYQASKSSRAIITSSENSNILTVGGFRYGVVVHVSEPALKKDFRKSIISWAKATEIIERKEDQYIGGGTLFDAFWRILIANHGFDPTEEHSVKASEKDREVAEMQLGLKHFENDQDREFMSSFMIRLKA